MSKVEDGLRANYPISLIRNEGICDVVLPAGIEKSEQLVQASIYLFKFILGDDDSRWGIVKKFVDAKEETQFEGVHVETALIATYLSKTNGHRGNYARYSTPESIRQLCRAVVNLSQWENVSNNVDLSSQEVELEVARTNKITRGTDRRGITGCPEALYQLRMFFNGTYVGRTGFNVHNESSEKIVSITNIQGVPNGKSYHNKIEDRLGTPPMNFLVGRVAGFAERIGADVRGLKNPKNGDQRMYNIIFKKERIDRFES